MLKLINHDFLVGEFDDSSWYIATGFLDFEHLLQFS